MSGTSSGQVYNCMFLLSKLIENVTTDNGYHNTVSSDSIIWQQPPLTVKRTLPIIYLYQDRLEFEAGISGRYNIEIQYSIVGEVAVGKGENTLLQVLDQLQSDLLVVLYSDLYLIDTAGENNIDTHLDHHVIYNVNTEGGLAYPKGMVEIQGGMYLHSTTLPLL